MQTAIIWVLFLVYPHVEPLLLTDSSGVCISRAVSAEERLIKTKEGEAGVVLRCVKIEVLVEEI